MRYAELLFLALLVLYHAVLLVPRHKRLFSANYLVFLVGMALAWNLGMEGLRWQTLPAVFLLFFDFLVLFPSLKSLRGNQPQPGWLSVLLGGSRTFVALVAFVWALGCSLLSVAFPLPQVEMTGGLPFSHRVVHFAASEGQQGLEVRFWYPAGGDLQTQPRPTAEAESWQRERQNGGLPVFWQSHYGFLPSSAIRGGRLAAPKTKYPVVFVTLPREVNVLSYGYLWEDLASRGFLVVAASPLPPPLAPPEAFGWRTAAEELARPWIDPSLWLEPEASEGAAAGGADFAWVGGGLRALRQLSAEPGDVFYDGVDWEHLGLWVHGSSGLPEELVATGHLKGVVRSGTTTATGSKIPELRLESLTPKKPTVSANQWVLSLPNLLRADLTDAAYLKPYLYFFGTKSQADSGFHGAVRQYQAAFYQYAFWHVTGEGSFVESVPVLPGLQLTGH